MAPRTRWRRCSSADETPGKTQRTTSSTAVTINADPYVWPYDGDIPVHHTALINIDWQVDFCGTGGYVAQDRHVHVCNGCGFVQHHLFVSTNTQAAIRAAQLHDIASTLEVVLAAGLFTTEDISVVEELLDRHFSGGPGDRVCLVGEVAGAVNAIAYAESTPAADRVWYLTMIAVSPGAQRAGVGSALLRTVENELSDRGQRLLLVETSALPEYEGARRFYVRSGYDEEARVRDFHEDGDDMVLFRKRLPRTRVV